MTIYRRPYYAKPMSMHRHEHVSSRQLNRMGFYKVCYHHHQGGDHEYLVPTRLTPTTISKTAPLVLNNIRNSYTSRSPSDRNRQLATTLPCCSRCEPCTWPSRDEETNVVTPPASPRGKVQFANTVQVVDIPSRRQYSSEERNLLWNNRKQLRFLARKNTAEYAFEKYNWRQAIEEDEMYHIQGRLVHPAHVQHKERLVQQLKAWNNAEQLATVSAKLAERQK